MDVRSLQKPLKEQYRRDPASSRITMTANGIQTTTPLSCSVDIGRAIYQAEAHKGVGGSGTAACSGDLLIGALAACAQLTCQLVATAMGVPTRHIEVNVSGDMDLCNSTLTPRRQLRNSCKRCRKRRNNIASFCKPCYIRRG